MDWIKIVAAIIKQLGLEEYEPKVRNYIILMWLVMACMGVATFYMAKNYIANDKQTNDYRDKTNTDCQRKIDSLSYEIKKLNDEVKIEIKNCRIEVEASQRDYIELLKLVSKIQKTLK